MWLSDRHMCMPRESLSLSLNLLPISSLSLPGASPVDSRFRSAAVRRSVSRLFRLPAGGAGGGGSSGSGECASPVRVGRQVPWAAQLDVAEPKPGGRWR